MQRGDVVGGRYRLTEPLASGGMGTVWRARHVELDVDVAVKVMSPALLRAPTALARFQREARAAAQLRSPHVVRVFDYGVHGDQPYLAMELLVGEDLRTFLERTGPLPLGRAAHVVDALAKALRVAHAAGIVHRDLKPANVFLERSGDDEIVKILDFGIAKDVAGATVDGLRTSTSTVVGSPLYMSPEQVRGAEVDHRTDLWSLATLTYEMVTGKQPFEGASLGDVFARIVADVVPPPSSVLAGLPPGVDSFFERALARSPDARFASATDLAAAFRASLGDHAVAMTRVHAPGPVARPDAPTVGVTPMTDEPDLAASEDELAVAPTERGEPGWPTSAGARSAPRIVAEEELAPMPTGDVDVGPLAQRSPSSRRRWPMAVGAAAVLSLGVVAVVVGRGASPSPPRPEVTAAVERRQVGGAPGIAPSIDVEKTPGGAAPAPSSEASAGGPLPPAAPSSASSTSSAASSAAMASAPPARPRAPRAPGGPAASPASPAPSSAIDPIFGVPVGGP